MSDMQGLRAVVTGGASGIGAAIAARLLTEGARVAVLDISPESRPNGTVSISCDLADDQSVASAVRLAAETMGGIDIVVNNAGIGAEGDVTANSIAEWHHVFDINVVGIARVAREALPYLRNSQHAAIVNVSSIVALIGLRRRALYSATKGAVSALTRAMAADHLHEGVRVNSVSPGTSDTPWIGRLLAQAEDRALARRALEVRQPHGRLVSPEEVADAVLYLAGARAGSTTGIDLCIDGGLIGVRVPSRGRP